MKDFLRATILMGVFLSGFLFSSQAVVGATSTFTIENYYYGGPDLRFEGGGNESAKVTGTTSDFTVECPETFSGLVAVSYSLFDANLHFEEGKFSYGIGHARMADIEVYFSGTVVRINRMPVLKRPVAFAIENASNKYSLSFRGFTTSSDVELKQRPENISSNTTAGFTIEYMPSFFQITSTILYEMSSPKGPKGILAVNMTFDQNDGFVTNCSINPPNPKIIVGHDSKSIRIEDTPHQVTFTIENHTPYSLSFEHLDPLDSRIGNSSISRQETILSGKVQEGSVSYPRSVKNVRFLLKYKLQEIHEYLDVFVFVGKERVTSTRSMTSSPTGDIVKAELIENKIIISPIEKK